MSKQTVTIKWGAKQYTTEVEESTTCKAFMSTLNEMTGVPIDKMKVMGFSGLLKPTSDTLKARGLKKNQKVMMIGHLPSKAVTEFSGPTTKFVEDLSKEERMVLLNETEKQALPIGIQNLGVTCYMNSCIQAIRTIAPVRDAIVKFGTDNPSAAAGPINDSSIAADISRLLVDLEGGVEAPKPVKLIASMRQKYPELARKSTGDMGFMQQDVDEFWHYLSEIFDKARVGGGVNPLKECFQFQMKTVTEFDSTYEGQTDIDASSLEKKVEIEDLVKMSAFMGSATNTVTLVQQAMRLALNTHLDKGVAELGDKQYRFRSESRLLTLPQYLNLHFVRFEWKQGEEGGTRAKVTRRIGFSDKLDLYELCSEELQTQLRPARNAYALDVTPGGTDDVDMEKPEEDPEVSYPDGSFSLVAIITHEGRTADSGHYVCWRKKFVEDVPKNKNDAKLWLKFDDDKVTEHPWDTIDLAGGRGDYHMAYLTFWKQNMVTVKKSLYDEAKKDCEERQQKMEEALAKKAASQTDNGDETME